MYLTHVGNFYPTWAIPTPLGPFRPRHIHINSVPENESGLNLLSRLSIQKSYSKPAFSDNLFMYRRYLLISISERTYVSPSFTWDFFIIVETLSLNIEFSNSYCLFVGIVVFIPTSAFLYSLDIHPICIVIDLCAS